MTYKEIIRKVAEDTSLPQTLVDRAYRAYWRAVREYITSLPLKEDMEDAEFLKLRPNVNIPSIGKLHVTLDRWHGVKKMNQIRKEFLKEKENASYTQGTSSVHQHNNDS